MCRPMVIMCGMPSPLSISSCLHFSILSFSSSVLATLYSALCLRIAFSHYLILPSVAYSYLLYRLGDQPLYMVVYQNRIQKGCPYGKYHGGRWACSHDSNFPLCFIVDFSEDNRDRLAGHVSDHCVQSPLVIPGTLVGQDGIDIALA